MPPSEKEIQAAAEAVANALRESLMDFDNIARAALSAAEKERNGSKLPAAQEGRDGEACFDLTCQEIATHEAPIDRHGWCLYCAEHAEGLTDARPLAREGQTREHHIMCSHLRGEIPADSCDCWERAYRAQFERANAAEAREGDVIEKLREWVAEQRVIVEGFVGDYETGVRATLNRLVRFLDLQEQSTEGDGTSPGEET